MNARRLTLIRRAKNAVEQSMKILQFSDAIALAYARDAHRYLDAAKRYTLGGAHDHATIALNRANSDLATLLQYVACK